MANRDKIIDFINNYLKIKEFEDHCVNGLQIEGQEELKKIVTGVSFNQELINRAIERKADMILVHHGVFGKKLFQVRGFLKDRLNLVLNNNINLAGYHLPLDAHSVVGNNILLLEKLGLEKLDSMNIGWIGKYSEDVSFEDFVEKVDQLLETQSYSIKAGKDKIRTVGIVSGGASKWIHDALDKKVDVFLSGDIRESIIDTAKEGKINFINAGHYRTEKFGIQALGELVANKFGVDVEFVEIDNEI